MPSPFPGMNPYIEQRGVFHAFHQVSISIIGELLNTQLPPGFYTAIESDLYIHELPAEQRRFAGRADVAVRTSEPTDRTTSASTAMQEAPAYGAFPTAVDELRLDR